MSVYKVCRLPFDLRRIPSRPSFLISKRWLAAISGGIALLLAAALAAQVPTGGTYSLSRQVIGSGGARATGGNFILVGTLGQAVTGPASGSAYAAQQGFHTAAPLPDQLFRNGFE